MAQQAVSSVTPIQPARGPSRTRNAALSEARLAQALLPGAVLQGCREAIQRVRATEMQSFGVTSAVRGEGRSSVAIGLALVEWLDYERRTVIVDLDLENPSLATRLGLGEGQGIAELIEAKHAMEDHLQKVAGDVWLLSAGRLREQAPRTLTRLAQGTILSQLSEWADAVIFDLPPLLGSPTGLEAARLCATPLMVVRAGVTPLSSVKEAASTLPVKPAVVLNGTHSSLPRWIRRAAGDWNP